LGKLEYYLNIFVKHNTIVILKLCFKANSKKRRRGKWTTSSGYSWCHLFYSAFLIVQAIFGEGDQQQDDQDHTLRASHPVSGCEDGKRE